MNALEWNRDLTQSIEDIRRGESGMADRPGRGRGTVCLPEMRRGGIGLCVATQIARIEHNSYSPVFGWRSQEQAWAQTQGQLAWYRVMEEAGQMIQIRDADELDRHVPLWTGASAEVSRAAAGDHGRAPARPALGPAVGYILSLEGADSIVTLGHLERAYGQGLRAIGPAHYGPGVYANGTDATGGFNAKGRELLKEMDRLGIILDVTHLCDDCFWEALDLFSGPLWASHQNCRALVAHHRQFSDEQIRVLIDRGAVIGAALDAWMLVPGWVRGQTTPQSAGLRLDRLLDHIDHVCQIAGNARHSGIGSDLDGAFGREQTPSDLDTIADLSRIAGLLATRGCKPADVELILSGNFIRFLRDAWRSPRSASAAPVAIPP